MVWFAIGYGRRFVIGNWKPVYAIVWEESVWFSALIANPFIFSFLLFST